MSNRLALVTGAVGGIGKAIAKRLSAVGVDVVISDLSGTDLNKSAADLNLPMIGADLSNDRSLDNLKDYFFKSGGYPDIIINAAGGVCKQTGADIENVTSNNWHEIFD